MNNTIPDDTSPTQQGTITLDGSLTVNEADELRMRLIKTLIDADDVRVEFGTVTDVDLSCLQLLCSAHRSATRMNRHLSLSAAWPEPFQQAVTQAGFARQRGCRFDTGHSCIWIKQ